MPNIEFKPGKIALIILDLYDRTTQEVFIENSKFINLNTEQKDNDGVTPHLTYAEYTYSSPLQQIKFLRQKITQVYNGMTAYHPHADWIIVAWREYGISNSACLSSNEKKKLKVMLTYLCRSLPKLIIIAGSILYQKKIAPKKLTEIINYYEPHKWIIEEEFKKNTDPKFSTSFENVKRALNIDHSIEKCFYKIKNVSYVGYNKIIKQHGKLTPFNDVRLNCGVNFFQPAKGRSLSPIIKISHVRDRTKKINIGIDICREHLFGLLKKYHEETKELVHLQFLLSDSIKFHVENFCANLAAFHIDSLNIPRMIIRNQDHANIIYAYSCNVFDKTSKIKPINPTYPIQFQILDKIDLCLSEHIISPDLKKQLLELKNQVIQLAPCIPIKLAEYKKLVTKLEDTQTILEEIIINSREYTEELSPIFAIREVFVNILKKLHNNQSQFAFSPDEIKKNFTCVML